MLIDIHTHTPAPTEVMPTPSPADHLQAMSVVDRFVVFPFATRWTPEGVADGYNASGANPNDQVHQFISTCPDRAIGFCTVDPRHPSALDEIDRCVGDLGLKGIKMGPIYQHFSPLDEQPQAVYAKAQELGLPILLHEGTSYTPDCRLIHADVIQWDEVAYRFPELRIVLAHMAHPWQVDCIAVIRKRPHVYADISALHVRPWSAYNCMRLATEWGVLDKLIFGSDYPIFTPAQTMAGLRATNDILEGTALPRVPEEEIEAIIHRDSLQLLGLT